MQHSNYNKFISGLVDVIKNINFSKDVNREAKLENLMLLDIKNYIQKHLSPQSLDGTLYYHGDTKEEKKAWSESKKLQTIKLYGTNVSDIFLHIPK